MSITLIKVGKKGAIKGTQVMDFEDLIQKYKVSEGQVYLAADGANHGVVVVDVKTHAKANKVVVKPISPMGVSGPDQVMDVHEMVYVDFYLVEPPYITWTKPVMASLTKPVTKRRKT